MSDITHKDLSSWEPPSRDVAAKPGDPRAKAPPAPPAPGAPGAPGTPAAPAEPAPVAGPVAWKAAASSVPRLREQPVAAPVSVAPEAFPGFAQDALAARVPGAAAERGDDESHAATPLSVEPPVWEQWLDRLRTIPRPVALGVGAGIALLVALSFVLAPRDPARVSLARLRQQPEAYDGRVVHVRGRAGETFSIGGSYVFNLRQGRDTIVVYSRTRRPRLHEDVRASGTVSVGYLDGAPRVALFEEPPTP
jgi:hypothetical protein